jgi:hypothetical protein
MLGIPSISGLKVGLWHAHVVKSSKIYRRVSVRGFVSSPEAQALPQPIRYLWIVHLRGCARREIPCEITISEYAELTAGRCCYCNAAPFNMTKQRGKAANILYNGIDRVDNTLGYTRENLVTCCKLCNAMKSALGREAFLMHARRIVTHQTGLGDLPPLLEQPAND